MKKKVAMILTVLLGISLIGCSVTEKTNRNARVLAAAQYPDYPVYPQQSDFESDEAYMEALEEYGAWTEKRDNNFNQLNLHMVQMGLFFEKMIPEFSEDAKEQNLVFSPMNVYMTLAMLAETTEGNSRQQILDLLGARSIEELRENAKNIGELHYRNEKTVNIMANSLWLRNDTEYKEETLDVLKTSYYTDTFQGVMGSDDYNQLLKDWINEKTGNMISEKAANLSFDKDTSLGLASTIHFQAKWVDPFQKENTAEGIFHAKNGDINAMFMARELEEKYCWGDRFGAVCVPLDGKARMWFLLPDEGVTSEQLLEDEEAVKFLYESGEWQNNKRMKIRLKVPGFDIQSSVNLQKAMTDLGITDVFNKEAADFKTLTDTNVFLTSAEQTVRMMIDEEGVAAAAYTILKGATAEAPPEEEMDFVVDRPFVCVITIDPSTMPLFVAVINTPVMTDTAS